MKLFQSLYEKSLEWAKHKHAPRYLGSLSFAESSFFPIPPDVMLIPMVLAKPNQWNYYALLTTITSILGGIAGYFLGLWSMEWLEPLIYQWGYGGKFELAKNWLNEWGVWIIFAAGFSPIPYKLFTISAGFLSMALLPFILASAIGRGARFYLVAGLVNYFGPKIEPYILKYIEWLGWIVVALIAIAILVANR